MENGFNVAEILSIEDDTKNNLWMSTSKGIIKFNPQIFKIWNYDVSDGLQGNLFHLGAHAKLKSGEIAFGGSHGFNVFYPDSIVDNPYAPPVYITDIKVYNKSLLHDKDAKESHPEPGEGTLTELPYHLKEVKLSYNQRIVTIEFTALSYSSSEKNIFAYQLDGFDKNWIYTTGKNRTATYTNLKGGNYLFKVKAANKDGVWNEKGAVLSIIIIPPFWQSNWFSVLVLLCIIYGIYLLFRRRLSHVRKRLDDINEHKEKELVRLRNDKLNAELDFKTKELAQSTMHVISKNEDIIELRSQLEELTAYTMPEGKRKVSVLLKAIDLKLDTSSTWECFAYNFNLVHHNFLNRFTEKYPDINQNDLKICAYIRMNLSTKEIANLLNISHRTVESTRYRIRKKINLDSDKTLNDYLVRF